MHDPSRATIAGTVFQDLRKLARAQGRSTDELLVFYVLERFLYRLSRSSYADRFTLKGGLLLATLDARRPTRDGDLLVELTRDESTVLGRISEIARIAIDDGVEFVAEQIRSAAIREGDLYEGVRVIMPARVASARLKLQLDVNFGDPVTPGVIVTEYPQLLNEHGFQIQGYPVETVLAEKLSTAISLGDANTRERDWADLWRLTGRHHLNGSLMRRALRAQQLTEASNCDRCRRLSPAWLIGARLPSGPGAPARELTVRSTQNPSLTSLLMS